MSATLTLRLNEELKHRLDRLADATQRSKSFLAAEAIREYLDLNEWQIREIKDAMREADANDSASARDVKRILNKWDVDAG